MDAGPLPLPEGWLEYVNGGETAGELLALRRSVTRGVPFGAEPWQQETALRLGSRVLL